jgi:hypothetical protein
MMPKKLTPRDTAELAVWICDDDPEAKLAWWKQVEAPRVFKESADACGVKLGPIRWSELQPGEGRAGHPPRAIQGTNVRLLVAECDVVGTLPVSLPDLGFTEDLSPSDLQRMRSVTRRAYGLVVAADGSSLRELRDDECDKIINLMAPEAAAREAVNATKH